MRTFKPSNIKYRIEGKWIYTYIDPNIIKCHKAGLSKAYKYAKMMDQGDFFPPIKIEITHEGVYRAKNGAHRTHAYRMLERMAYVKYKKTRACGEIGRRNGLKIRREQSHGGSSPPLPTKK